MHPICGKIGPLTIHWYGVFMAVGFLSGLVNWTWLGRREGRSFNFCSDLLFWVMLSGIVGGRLAYVIAEWPSYVAHPLNIVRVDQGGLIFYGGFVAGVAAVVAFARARRLAPLEMLDFAATSVPVAHAFGRVGCFINGCCFGSVTDGPFGVAYPRDSNPAYLQIMEGQLPRYARESLPVHPVQLYEAVANLAIWAALVWAYRRSGRRAGSVTALYLMLYPVARFALEAFRGDDRPQWLGLSMAQAISVAVFAAGAWLMARVRRRPTDAAAECSRP